MVNQKEKLTIALPKGRLLEDSANLFSEIGLDTSVLFEKTRKLILSSEKDNIDYLIIRAVDIPIYVEYGAADIGVVGKDILSEQNKNIIELLDLKIGYCRLVLAKLKTVVNNSFKSYVRVATKYPNITELFFRNKGMQVEVIKLYGSIELSPVVSLSEYIVDLVSTGQTLKDNGLIEVETILESTARLVCNRQNWSFKYSRINNLCAKLNEKIKKIKL